VFLPASEADKTAFAVFIDNNLYPPAAITDQPARPFSAFERGTFFLFSPVNFPFIFHIKPPVFFQIIS
jgi:hypothetical protein